MATCLADCIRPEAARATVLLLRRLGHEVEFPEDQTCCGQPMYNSGYADLAREQARHTIRVFDDGLPVIVPSGSCAAMVKHEFPHLLAEDSAWRQRARDLASRTFELTGFLVNQLQVLDLGARYEGRVTHHYACHQRMLGATDQVEQLLAHVEGCTYAPLRRQDQCCGFGGSFAVRYSEISGAMVDDKARSIIASGADTVVSTDTGCLMNIGGRLRRLGSKVRVRHIAEVLASPEVIADC